MGNTSDVAPPVQGQGQEERLRLEAFVPYRLSLLSNTVSAAIAGAYAARFRLSIPEWRVMAVLGLEPGLSAAQVAERTAMDKVAVSRAVTGLLRSRRVLRALADADRRRSVLKLSRAGEEVYWRVIPFARRYEQQLLEDFSASERAQLDQLLTRLLKKARSLGPVDAEG
jgi:DNA-binding MarR family transcriptional regulator